MRAPRALWALNRKNIILMLIKITKSLFQQSMQVSINGRNQDQQLGLVLVLFLLRCWLYWFEWGRVAGDIKSPSLRSWKLETFYELQYIVKKTVEGNNLILHTHSHRGANHAVDQLAKNSVNLTLDFIAWL
jgi:hypothetical protein